MHLDFENNTYKELLACANKEGTSIKGLITQLVKQHIQQNKQTISDQEEHNELSNKKPE